MSGSLVPAVEPSATVAAIGGRRTLILASHATYLALAGVFGYRLLSIALGMPDAPAFSAASIAMKRCTEILWLVAGWTLLAGLLRRRRAVTTAPA